jgi:tetratricopeptide (TPR) repeat protein
LSTFINSISKGVSAFKSRNYVNALQDLTEAFDAVENEDFLKIDSEIFNALCDAQEITALMSELPVFEKNEFLASALNNLKSVLLAFTKPEGSTAAALLKSLENFIILVQGMNVALKYIQLKKFRADDFPPQVSFEITSDALIKLYLWTEEQDGKVAKISQLKQDFEELFDKERKSKKYYLDRADELFKNAAYDDCINLLEQAASDHESLKMESYLRIGHILLELNKAAEALDYYMKARVLGATKIQLSEGIRKACTLLLQHPEYKSQKSALMSLMEDFS